MFSLVDGASALLIRNTTWYLLFYLVDDTVDGSIFKVVDGCFGKKVAHEYMTLPRILKKSL